jgi:hypothetical protein
MRKRGRPSLRRVHIWLGWIVGLPLLMWTLSGLVMVLRPIEEVRGEDLWREAPSIAPVTAVSPQIGPRPVKALTLEQRGAGPVWIIRYTDGGGRLADARTGRLLPTPTAAQAAELVREHYTGEARIAGVDRTSADKPPLELRRNVAAWRVSMSDGTRFYLDAQTGALLARRTGFWRFYDFMWGLHIMDPGGREDSHNPWVIGFSLVSLLSIVLALVLLPRSFRRRNGQ